VAANVVRAAMYVVGIGESLRDVLRENNIYILDGGLNDIRLYCIGKLLCPGCNVLV
jgi:hypothetical protein